MLSDQDLLDRLIETGQQLDLIRAERKALERSIEPELNAIRERIEPKLKALRQRRKQIKIRQQNLLKIEDQRGGYDALFRESASCRLAFILIPTSMLTCHTTSSSPRRCVGGRRNGTLKQSRLSERR